MRVARVVPQGAKQLRAEHRLCNDERNRGARAAGTGSGRANVSALAAGSTRSGTAKLLAGTISVFRVLDGKAGRVVARIQRWELREWFHKGKSNYAVSPGFEKMSELAERVLPEQEVAEPMFRQHA